MLVVGSHLLVAPPLSLFFFFNDTATTEIYTLSLHDALPICLPVVLPLQLPVVGEKANHSGILRSEEHTSELQSRLHLVCRLLLEKKKTRSTPLAVSSMLCRSGRDATTP